MDRGYPRSIRWDFRGIGSRVDAVFENYGEDLLVFGHRYLRGNIALFKPWPLSFLQAICISHPEPGSLSTTLLQGE